MDTRTGEIKRLDEIAEKDLRHYVPLTGEQSRSRKR